MFYREPARAQSFFTFYECKLSALLRGGRSVLSARIALLLLETCFGEEGCSELPQCAFGDKCSGEAGVPCFSGS